MTDLAIEARGIRKSYKNFLALDDVDLTVRKQTVHGFLGPNGAGKTTVIRILLGLLHPDDAEIEIFGKDLFTNRNDIMKQVGAIVENPAFFDYLTAYENLYFLANLSGPLSKQRIEEVLDIVGLSHVRNKKVGEFSFGMKQRLGIAQSLLPDNKLIFLDEPVNGLDPHGILDIRNLIKRLCNEEGVTVFLSSHLLVEVQYICDYVSIIDKGRKICEEKVSDLLSRETYVELKTPDKDKFLSFAEANKLDLLETPPHCNDRDTIIFTGTDQPIPALVKELVQADIAIEKINHHEKNLEEIFVELTSQN